MIQIISYEILNCVKTERVPFEKIVADYKELEVIRKELALELNVLKSDLVFNFRTIVVPPAVI